MIVKLVIVLACAGAITYVDDWRFEALLLGCLVAACVSLAQDTMLGVPREKDDDETPP